MKQEGKKVESSTHKTHEHKVGLFIPKKELSWAIAFLIATAFFVFTAGYFWGQKRAISGFLGTLEEESFSDKITYSLYTMDGKYLPDNEEEEGAEDQDASEESQIEEVKIAQEDTATPIHKETTLVSTVTYVAPLVGFGTLHAANKFAQRVENMGIPVHVKRRVSKSVKGRTVAWYQVMTDVYHDKNEIEHVVMRIKDKEKIKDVKIIERTKGQSPC